jgi:hypothetical protein
MPKKTTVREAIRVVGHLLETNGTTQVFARNKRGRPVEIFNPKACKFCLSGAADLVAVNVLGIDKDDFDRLVEFEDKVGALVTAGSDRVCGHISMWDEADKTERKKIIAKLKNA